MPLTRVTTKRFLRCACCGLNAPIRQITRGALGGHSLQALEQRFVGRGRGDNGGAIIWSRRPMNRDELEHVARAVAAASDSLLAQLGEDITAERPEAVLAGIDDDADAETVGAEWVAEALAELERRQRIVDDEKARRRIK